MTKEGSKCKPATKAELKWIEDFKKLAKRCPKSIWIYANGYDLNIMKYPEGSRDRMMNKRDGGGVDPDNIIGRVEIANDGGDW